MSKQTLANRLREFADKIEKLPEEVHLDVRFCSHCYRPIDTPESVKHAVSLGEGCESFMDDYEGTYWVGFDNMHGEPISLRVFYDPSMMQTAPEPVGA